MGQGIQSAKKLLASGVPPRDVAKNLGVDTAAQRTRQAVLARVTYSGSVYSETAPFTVSNVKSRQADL